VVRGGGVGRRQECCEHRRPLLIEGIGVRGLGFRVLRFRVWGSEFRVWGSGLEV
jgi:hypothetical protein